MPTEITITRRPSFSKSDSLREDEKLYAEAQSLGEWLAARDLDVVTMTQLLAYSRATHPDAALARGPIEYLWVWDPLLQLWYLKCSDRGTVSFVPEGDVDPILIQITISARY